MVIIRKQVGDPGLAFEFALMRNRPDLRESTSVLVVDDGTLDQGALAALDAYPNVAIAETRGGGPGSLTPSFFGELRRAVSLHLCQPADREGARRIHVITPSGNTWDGVYHALRWCLSGRAGVLRDFDTGHPRLDDVFSTCVPVIEDECAAQLQPYI